MLMSVRLTSVALAIRSLHSSKSTMWRWRNNNGSYRGGSGNRRSPRSGGGSNNSQILLDKFVKHLAYDGSLVVRSPFNIKVRGSYFDDQNNVDRQKNKEIYDEIYNNQGSPPEVKRSTPEPETEEATNHPPPTTVERNILDKLAETIDTYAKVLGGANETPVKKSPLHVLLYGRNHHRVDSCSIIDANGTHTTHVYLTDASSFEEAKLMMLDTLEINGQPDANISFWQPKQINNKKMPTVPKGKKLKHLLNRVPTTQTSSSSSSSSSSTAPPSYTLGTPYEREDDLMASMKIYCPRHLLAVPNLDVRSAFLVPTIMNRIYLQGDRSSHVELDASLIHKLHSVGISTEIGNIRVRDLISDEIRLASQMGDIMCEGQLEGHAVVEINGDGDFLASFVEGPSLLVTTDDGDINVWGDCNVDVSQFYTRNGHINVRYLYNQCYMLVKDSGNITVNVVEGFLTAVVKNGAIFASIDKLTADSTLQIEDGDITVSVPRKRNFRIMATGPRTNIVPKILNAGDIFPSEKIQTFKCDPTIKEKNPSENNNDGELLPCPVLKIEVTYGTVNIVIIPETENDKVTSEGFDSTTTTTTTPS